MTWTLHPQLAADTHRVAQWPLCDVLLMDDARFPWLILVPRVVEAMELIDLDNAEQRDLWDEIARASHLLKHAVTPEKLNVAALGNMVPQLHVHVIARFRTDAAWPKPVWGVGERATYAPEALAARLQAFARADQFHHNGM